MTRAILHAGFHKTGTSTLQSFFRQNLAALKPVLRYAGKQELGAVADATRRVSLGRIRSWQRMRFRRSFAAFLATLDPADTRPLVISWEGFSGTIPGHGRARDYAAAVPLAVDAARLLRTAFDEVTLVYTTRDEADWRRSAHAHLARYRPVMDAEEPFWSRCPGAPGFAQVLPRIASAVSPCTVEHRPLESLAGLRLGPAEAVLDLLDLPTGLRERLKPVPPANVGQTARETEALIEVNRRGGYVAPSFVPNMPAARGAR